MASPPDVVNDEESLHRMLLANGNGVRDGEVHYMAFYSSSYPFRISVDRGEYRTISQSLANWGSQNGVARLEAAHVRGLEFTPPLEVEAVPEHGNDAHAEIVVDENKFSKNRVKTKVCRKLAALAKIVRDPTIAE